MLGDVGPYGLDDRHHNDYLSSHDAGYYDSGGLDGGVSDGGGGGGDGGAGD